MKNENNGKNAQARLCIMLFLQYMLLAVWWIPYAAYLTNEGISDSVKAIALSAMAVGFMASSIVGAFADRYFSAQRVLSFTNLVAAGLLLFAGLMRNSVVTMVSVYALMLLYMPTWSLTGSIVLKHVRPEQFPRVRLFGTLGWVSSGLFSLVFVKLLNIQPFDGSILPFFCGSAIALTAGIFDFFLPDTPPSAVKEKFSIGNILGFKAFVIFKDRNFLLFFLCTFTAVLGYSLYYTYGSMFLQDRKFELITVTMNWGQVGELFFLFITTIVLSRLGFKKTMIIGLSAMVARYASFWYGSSIDSHTFYIIGILFHGIIFGLFFVSGQIYTDQKSPANMRAQAQGLLAFLVWGIALLAGNFLCSSLIKINTTIDSDGIVQYQWPSVFAVVTIFSAIVLTVFILFFRDEKK
ncbi:MAG: MFS transporter [Dysgonamonadaceae bacterium]|jgi:nucleoside transporter|nr:MFS transporter [Dysgonamonadaceae bacterium]